MRIDRRQFVAGVAALAAAPAWARGPARYPAPDRETMVPVAGGRIYVRVNGDLAGPKPPVVFLHGGPGARTARIWMRWPWPIAGMGKGGR